MNVEQIARKFNQHSDTVLSLALLIAGVVIIALALSPANKWAKALALAYIVLP